MGFQSKTYSLSDEVVAAIEAARENGETPNQLLKRVLVDMPGAMYAAKDYEPSSRDEEIIRDIAVERQRRERPVAKAAADDFDPRSIPGVSVGLPEKKEPSGFPCRCVHSGCRGSKFTGTSRFQSICPDCIEQGHKGEPRNCSACADNSGTGAI